MTKNKRQNKAITISKTEVSKNCIHLWSHLTVTVTLTN